MPYEALYAVTRIKNRTILHPPCATHNIEDAVIQSWEVCVSTGWLCLVDQWATKQFTCTGLRASAVWALAERTCSCAKCTKTCDLGTTKSDPIVKTNGSKTIGLFVHIGHESGYS